MILYCIREYNKSSSIFQHSVHFCFPMNSYLESVKLIKQSEMMKTIQLFYMAIYLFVTHFI